MWAPLLVVVVTRPLLLFFTSAPPPQVQAMEIIFLENEQKLSLIGQDLQEIPAALAEEYGPKVKRLDLSYNKLRYLKVCLTNNYYLLQVCRL